jgi:signal peptidase
MLKYIPIPVEVTVRFIIRVLIFFVLTSLFVVGLSLAAPKLIGGQSYAVLSGSMSPEINTGDMVAVIPLQAKDIKVGEIVAFNDPEGSGRLFQHRVQSIEKTGIDNSSIQVVTKGDANSSFEQWMAGESDQLGKVAFSVPKIGYPIRWITGGGGQVFLFERNIPVAMLILVSLLIIFALLSIFALFKEPASEDNSDNSNDDPDLETKEFKEINHAL